MRTGRSLTNARVCFWGGGGRGPGSDPPSISPLGVGLDLIPLNFPLGCGPGSDPPQFHPWVWAWIWSPSISPMGVGLDLIPLNFPLGCRPGGGSPFWGMPPSWGGCFLGGLSLRGGLLGRGVSLLRGASFRGGLLAAGSPSMHWGRPPPPREQTGVKILPWPQLRCGR